MSGSPKRVTGFEVLEPSSSALPRLLGRSWIGSRIAGTLTSKECACLKKHFNSLCYNAHPQDKFLN